LICNLATRVLILGFRPQLSIADLIAAGARIDRELLRSVVSKSDNGLHVIPAPIDIMPLEAANSEQMLRIIELAREEYDHVILDLPSNWTNWTLSLVALSDVVFFGGRIVCGQPAPGKAPAAIARQSGYQPRQYPRHRQPGRKSGCSAR
jgi:pilus assembly protein CpaE